jgi:hypothetical protein
MSKGIILGHEYQGYKYTSSGVKKINLHVEKGVPGLTPEGYGQFRVQVYCHPCRTDSFGSILPSNESYKRNSDWFFDLNRRIEAARRGVETRKANKLKKEGYV